MDNVNKIVSKIDNSRILVIVSVIYVVIITAIGMYLYMKFNEKERFDRRFVKRLEDHNNEPGSMYISSDGFFNGYENSREIVKPIETKNKVKIVAPVSIVNCHIKTAFNCCAVNTYRNSWVSLEALKYCLDIGMKCLDFEIYSVNGEPVIGLNSREKNIDLKESFNKIPLTDAIDIINNFNGENLSTSVKELPLIIHFRIKTKQKEALKSFARQVKRITNIHNQSYYTIANAEKCVIHRPIYGIGENLLEKTIVIANFTSINPSNSEIKQKTEFYKDFISDTGIDSAVNLISPSKFCDYTTNIAAQTNINNSESKIEPTKLTFSAPFSDFEGSCVPFEPKEVAKSGVQLIGICAQKNLERNTNSMVYKYFQLFAAGNDKYVSYVTKNQNQDLHVEYDRSS